MCPEQWACTGAAYQHHWQFFRQIIIALCHQLTGHKVRDLFCCLASLIHRLLIDRHVRFVGDVVAIVAGRDEK